MSGFARGKAVSLLNVAENRLRTQRLIRGLRDVRDSLLDLLFPRRCAGCEETWLLTHEGFWCKDCSDHLLRIQSPLCPHCGRPFPHSPSSPDHLCGECLSGTFLFDSARSATIYSGVVRKRIHQFKFGGFLHWSRPLAELLDMTLREDPFPRIDMMLPVPLHIKRLRDRGFNQSGLLAEVLGRRVGLPVHYAILTRRHWTRPQVNLKREERVKNVRNAFGVVDTATLKDRSVLLIDDVYTTGTTLNECAKALKAAGAGQVHALTVARVVPGWRGDIK